jgi:hypothetical protein
MATKISYDGFFSDEATQKSQPINPSFSTRRICYAGSRSKTSSLSKGLHYKRALSALSQELSARADARRWLGRQDKVELFEQEFVFGLRMRVGAQT